MKPMFYLGAVCVGFVMIVATIILVTMGLSLVFDVTSDGDRGLLAAGVALGFLVFGGFVGNVLKGYASRAKHRRNTATEQDEVRIMQEIYNGLTQMEKRIESLETIMIDKHREAPW